MTRHSVSPATPPDELLLDASLTSTREVDLARAERLFAEERRDEKIRDSHAPATRRAYAADWAGFCRWCDRMVASGAPQYGIPATDAVLATWVGALDGLALSTVRRKLSAVRLAHARLEHPLPESLPATRAALRGHAREQADRKPRRQLAATVPILIRLVDAIDVDDSLHALRNRALLLVGFDGALRRSELVGIDHEHLRPTAEGYRLWLPRSKGARPDERVEVAVRRQPERHYCARARWCDRARRGGSSTSGPSPSRRTCARPPRTRAAGGCRRAVCGWATAGPGTSPSSPRDRRSCVR